MIKKIACLLMLGSIALLPFGCTLNKEIKSEEYYTQKFPFHNIQFTPLNRQDYIIIGDVVGKATAIRNNKTFQVRLISPEVYVTVNTVVTYSVPDYYNFDLIEQAAIYDALSKIEGADALIAIKVKRQEIITGDVRDQDSTRKIEVEVRGKAIKIKTDKQ